MKKSDFDEDVNELQTLVTRAANSYKRATARYLELIELWNDVGQKHFNGQVSFKREEGDAFVSGNVSGKPFSIYSTMLYRGGEALLEARLAVKEFAPEKEVLVGKFQVAPNGAIYTADGEAALPNTDDMREYKVLSAIVRRVLGVSNPAV
ncbi:hypothetical protein [Pseudomonas taiwanensis]|uniref:hypothetical protein n=1 Tax=Pseudomonas taiwanensis TaxID=470150 RepID=UPI0016492F8C|nr:hypothetical protein [Pseudomonas taiwanensis]MBC3491927.1 hypothetical protein [Pseudomonas taiwanensis]